MGSRSVTNGEPMGVDQTGFVGAVTFTPRLSASCCANPSGADPVSHEKRRMGDCPSQSVVGEEVELVFGMGATLEGGLLEFAEDRFECRHQSSPPHEVGRRYLRHDDPTVAPRHTPWGGVPIRPEVPVGGAGAAATQMPHAATKAPPRDSPTVLVLWTPRQGWRSSGPLSAVGGLVSREVLGSQPQPRVAVDGFERFSHFIPSAADRESVPEGF